MKKITYSLILLVLLFSLVMAGCTKSATKGGEGIATSTSEIPFPVGPSTNPNRMTEIISSTQTAAVVNEQPTEPVVVEATATPVVDVVPTDAPPVVVVPTSTPGVPSTYTISEGEFPYCLARRYNVNPSDLLSLNGLSRTTNYLAPGTTLKIPANSTWPDDAASRMLKTHPTNYTVQSGDTIYKIACLFGDVDPNVIIAANNLQSPYTLSGGQTLQIP